MIIKFDFDDGIIQYISCSSKVGRKINRIRTDFENWIHDETKNKKYWYYENGERYCPSFDAKAIIHWLNNVKFKKGIAKARLINSPQLRVKKRLYF
ncbi:hypothetical protein [Ammoniphilus sp. 3BR4]|uniref:hypothetical protein n=1 Tax=Ammoniphilus sp. 3BR4 TaxID=3158265 RepID=UPI003467207A